MIDNRTPITVSNIQTDPRSENSEFARKERLVSCVGIPLIAKDDVLGIIAFYTRELHVFSEDEIEFLKTIAGQTAIGIYHSKLYQDVRRKSNELFALYSVAAIASKFLDVGPVLLETLRKILEIFRSEAGRIYLLDRASGDLHLVTQEGFSRDVMPPTRYKVGDGIVGKAFEREDALVFEDIQTDADYQRYANRKSMLSAGFRSSFFIPIRVRGQNLGVMNFLSKEPRDFTPSDVRLINAIGYHLGIAVGNANLFAELKQKTLELENSNKVKDEFLGVISHELRTPLNVSMGYTTLVKNRVFGDINSDQEAALGKALKHSEELQKTIGSVLTLRALENNEVKREIRAISLRGFLEDVQSHYMPLAGPKVALRWNYAAELPSIKSDEVKLRQVLHNLIDNAIKFTEEGHVTLSVRHLPESSAIEFKVSDTGIGIAREKLADIFEMFRQVDSSQTRKYEGIGVGLFIAQKFTEILGGMITVESELHSGSTFTVTIPVEAETSMRSDLLGLSRAPAGFESKV